jgi:hypothetical protein
VVPVASLMMAASLAEMALMISEFLMYQTIRVSNDTAQGVR